MLVDAVDIVVFGHGGALALVEVKNVRDLTLPLANSFMESWGDPARRDGARYVFFVSQDRAFLWKPQGGGNLAEADVWDFPVTRELEPYSERLASGVRLRHDELRTVVWTWLSDLADLNLEPNVDPRSPLVTSGFLDDLRSGPAVITVAEA